MATHSQMTTNNRTDPLPEYASNNWNTYIPPYNEYKEWILKWVSSTVFTSSIIPRTWILMLSKFGCLSSCCSHCLLHYLLFVFRLSACFFSFLYFVCLSVYLSVSLCVDLSRARKVIDRLIHQGSYYNRALEAEQLFRCVSIRNKQVVYEVEIETRSESDPFYMPFFTSVTMDNPSRNHMQQTKAVNISLRWPRLRCRGNKSTMPVTTPSIPTNLMQKRQNSFAWNKRNSTRISQFICDVSCPPWQLVSAVGGD